jgi:hypothetical protein
MRLLCIDDSIPANRKLHTIGGKWIKEGEIYTGYTHPIRDDGVVLNEVETEICPKRNIPYGFKANRFVNIEEIGSNSLETIEEKV